MAVGFVRSRRYPVVLEEDKPKPKDEQTIFYLRPISAALRSDFDDAMRSRKEDSALEGYGKWTTRILHETLVGWENLRDEKGDPISFEADKGGGATDGSLDALLATHRYEIAGLSLSGAYLGEVEKKT